MDSGKSVPGWHWNDYSLWLLLISNIVTIYLAVSEGWSLIALMLVYWCQSVIIGLFTFLRIMVLKDSEILAKTPAESKAPKILSLGQSKIFTAFFFMCHYGFFHAGYLFFIVMSAVLAGFPGVEAMGFMPAQGGIAAIARELPMMGVAVCLFFINHLVSFAQYLKEPKMGMDLQKMMFFPYARILPMHLTIVIGYELQGFALPFFLALKAIADVGMHLVEHRDG
ncbi:MAG: DUF6498-containing protein [Candidatus Micrarchaeia archaeon]